MALGLSLSNVTGNDYFVNVRGAKLQLDSEGCGREDGETKAVYADVARKGSREEIYQLKSDGHLLWPIITAMRR